MRYVPASVYLSFALPIVAALATILAANRFRTIGRLEKRGRLLRKAAMLWGLSFAFLVFSVFGLLGVVAYSPYSAFFVGPIAPYVFLAILFVILQLMTLLPVNIARWRVVFALAMWAASAVSWIEPIRTGPLPGTP